VTSYLDDCVGEGNEQEEFLAPDRMVILAARSARTPHLIPAHHLHARLSLLQRSSRRERGKRSESGINREKENV
jgi:hypothetical protein